ncbi:unnamed protein product [Bemisia tabaci]|uniref:Uncharacterized protein n=1 Tax=Bemisia tabaci TaxID=7038 RepID=A0A9P0A0W7_BEMTA|nr:unnamed protein product [Bemisia tabaci]
MRFCAVAVLPILLFFACSSAMISDQNPMTQFRWFRNKYGKTYATKTLETQRFETFKKNLIKIRILNTNRMDTASFGVTKFVDLSSEEFVKLVGGEIGRKVRRKVRRTKKPARRGARHPKPNQRPYPRSLNPRGISIPRFFSWSSNSKRTTGWRSSRASTNRPFTRSSDARQQSSTTRHSRTSANPSLQRFYMDPVGSRQPPRRPQFSGYDPRGSPIKDWRVPANLYPPVEQQWTDQYYCGSCWSFACAAAAEILYARQERSITMLSKQDLIDCVGENDGCEGGSIHEGLEWMSSFGVSLAHDYPFTAVTSPCQYLETYLRIGSYRRLGTDNDWPQTSVIERELETSPLTCGIPNFPLELQFYTGGVVAPECNGPLGHAVVIVGHYAEAWIIRNSWGVDWGIQGHFLLQKNSCGVGYDIHRIDGPLEEVFWSEPPSSSDSYISA